MPAASHHSILHAAFIVNTDAGLRAQDDDEDHSLVYAYPPNAPAGSTGGFVKPFSSLMVTVRGALDSICGEKTRLVHLEHGGRRLLLASAHLESVMLILALRSVVPPAAATSLALHLAETLVLLLGPCAEWGLMSGGSTSFVSFANDSGQPEDTRAILDRIFEGVLSQVDSPLWGPRMAPWTSFEPSCLHLSLPTHLHTRLATLLSDHGAQRSRAPFSFFRKHFCLMYRGFILASDLQPPHAKQLWHLLWTLGVHQHSGGLPCQVLTRSIHLPQLQLQPAAGAAAAAAAASVAAGRGTSATASAAGTAAAAAAAAVALQAESGVALAEQQMGRSLLVAAAALRLMLVVVLTGYDEEIEEELAGRLEGHSAAELLQRVHTALGPELERLVEGSAIYSAAARALETPPAPAPVPAAPSHQAQYHHQRSDSSASGLGLGFGLGSRPAKPKGGGASLANSGSLLFRVMTRNRSSPTQQTGSAGFVSGNAGDAAAKGGEGAGGGGDGGGGAATSVGSGEAPPLSPSGQPLTPGSPRATHTHRSALAASLPPGPPMTPTASRPTNPHAYMAAATADGFGASPAGQPHDPGPSSNAAAGSGGVGVRGPGITGGGGVPGGMTSSGGSQPVGSPFEGVLLVIAHDSPHGYVRFLGDVPRGGGVGEAALAAVWRAVAACRARFGLHNVAVAAPPKHARLTMTLDQILQLSAARSNKLGGQRLGAADSTPWQYHPELASLAAVNIVTLKLQLPPTVLEGRAVSPAAAAAPEGIQVRGEELDSGAQRRQGAAAAAAMTPPGKTSWLTRMSGSRRTSSAGAREDSPLPGSKTPTRPPTPAAVAVAGSSPEPSTPVSSLLPFWAAADSPSLRQGPDGTATGPDTTTTPGTTSGAGVDVTAGTAAAAAVAAVAVAVAGINFSSTALYLTGILLPDSREVYLCHTADVDEMKLAELIWETAAGLGAATSGGAAPGPGAGLGAELWVQEE